MRNLLVIVLLLTVYPAIKAQAPKGHLYIVGGGERSDSLWSHFVELGGGKSCKALIVPYAASDDMGEVEQTGREQAAELRKIGCDADYIAITPDRIDSPKALSKLKGVTAVFFSGGRQKRLTRLFNNSKFFERVRQIYNEGGVVGGTSAGAAVMSQIMLTGGEAKPVSRRDKFACIREGDVMTSEGFGFVRKMIVDQHFIIRKRENRLMSILLENPGLKAVGIDESTAIVVNPDDSFRVIGHSQVMVFEPEDKAHVTPDGHQGIRSMRIRLLTAGDTYRF